MEMSELIRDQVAPAQKASAPMDPHLLLAQLGGEVARTLSAALERVTSLADTGRIDRNSLHALRSEVEHARRAGIMGQQVSRFASGRVNLHRERQDLTRLLLEVVHQRQREIDARGIEVRQRFAQAEVLGDATLTFSLLQSLFDWAFDHAVSRIDLQLDIKPWPRHARLSCAFGHRSPQEIAAANSHDDDATAAELETMSWCLLQQTALAMGLITYRHDTASRTTLTLEFPATVVCGIDGLSTSELEDPSQHAHSAQPLAGRHALVVASRREVRSLVRDALRPLGLMLDFVSSVEEAIDFCRDGLPQAVVYEACLTGERFDRLREDMLAEVPTMAFVQIAEQGKAFEVLKLGTYQFASVGLEAVLESLPAAMLFELARSDHPAR
jgi:CheY-like chemotaxis protein